MRHDADAQKVWADNLKSKNSMVKGLYYIIPEKVWEDPFLDILSKHIYGYLVGRVRKQGRGRCFPSVDTIAAGCRISRISVIRALKTLKDSCWIDYKRTGGANDYRVFSPREHENKVYVLQRMHGMKVVNPESL